jgi:aminoglycoside 3'-phosphotransferase II
MLPRMVRDFHPQDLRSQALMRGLPRAWQSDLARDVTPVSVGMSAASVFRLQRNRADIRFLKVADGAEANTLREEIARTGWLGAQGIRVPAILREFDNGARAAMIARAVPGVPPDEASLPARSLVASLAEAFARLHAIPADACPFDESTIVRLARARTSIARSAIDPSQFHRRNARLTPQQLFDRIVSRLPAAEDTVVVHGDATFENILIAEDGTIGFVDCGHAGRGDRYIDLALVAEGIAGHLGRAWIAPFMQHYAVARWDNKKARLFSDLYELF